MAPLSGSSPKPLFRAVTNTTRPLYQLLRCINFTHHKVHVQISDDGIRFSADNARVMQGVAVLDSCLFSSYTLNLTETRHDEETSEIPTFQINLGAFLETLQILGSVDLANRAAKTEQDGIRSAVRTYRPDAFSNQALGISGTCCFIYAEEGAPFSVIIEESGVKTTANLTTYTPEFPEDIPFDRSDIAFKIIMQPRCLLDALGELATMVPRKLRIEAVNRQPWLILTGKGGDFGVSSYDFSRGRELLESAAIHDDHWAQVYKFDLIKAASEAMKIANKVSFRGDRQGVLSLQFMVEVDGAGSNFLDFKFVPFISHDEDEDEDNADDTAEDEDMWES